MSYEDRDRVVAWFDEGGAEGLTTLDRAILIDLAEHANSKTGLAWPGNKLLARRWGVSERSIERSIARLHKFDLIETAKRATGQYRARYALKGVARHVGRATQEDGQEVARHVGRATQESSPTLLASSPTQMTKKPDTGVGRISESSRSLKRSDDDSARARSADAARRGASSEDDKGDTGAQGTAAMVSSEVLAEVMEKIGMPEEAAVVWIQNRFVDRYGNARAGIRSPDHYIRTCIENYSPPKPGANGSEPAKAKTTKRKAKTKRKTARGDLPTDIHCDFCGDPMEVEWGGSRRDKPWVVGGQNLIVHTYGGRYYHMGDCHPLVRQERAKPRCYSCGETFSNPHLDDLRHRDGNLYHLDNKCWPVTKTTCPGCGDAIEVTEFGDKFGGPDGVGWVDGLLLIGDDLWHEECDTRT